MVGELQADLFPYFERVIAGRRPGNLNPGDSGEDLKQKVLMMFRGIKEF